MNRRSLDNITIVMIGKLQPNLAFKNFEQTVTRMHTEGLRHERRTDEQSYRSK